jgi:hypothetical protein
MVNRMQSEPVRWIPINDVLICNQILATQIRSGHSNIREASRLVLQSLYGLRVLHSVREITKCAAFTPEYSLCPTIKAGRLVYFTSAKFQLEFHPNTHTPFQINTLVHSLTTMALVHFLYDSDFDSFFDDAFFHGPALVRRRKEDCSKTKVKAFRPK